ncbi:hypothetical protein GCM10022226_74410 [Sphaerisporangium flaviroseum]|uniref:ATP-grasp domain-containing protein n=1 Tax=Sphaerisporangium flaviroseum TaxID=509199 RepID=A0ABP7JDL4_9ACTN
MTSTPCFLVIGYNNTRIYDVRTIRDISRREYRAKVVLITEQAKPQDRAAADEVLVTPFGPIERAVERICGLLRGLGLRPIGVLPFADRGVQLGAVLARRLGLPGADPSRAAAGFDKRRFREIEASAPAHPSGYTRLPSLPVGTLGELEAAVERLGGTAFVKPAAEGNSRGCQIISGTTMCREAWAALAPYREAGVLVEELVRDAREYSWDFVGGARWLTAKLTSQDRFRAEIQQIVPAPLAPEESAALDECGEHMRQLVSAGNGAFHNELFLREDGVTAVETNMRPAGMRIWDLARLAFADFDPWRAWLRWSAGGGMRLRRPVARAVSGIRMLRAPRDGVLAALPDVPALAAELGIPLHEAAFTASASDRVRADVADNAAFIGHIMLVAYDAQTLVERLDRLSAAVEKQIVVHAR